MRTEPFPPDLFDPKRCHLFIFAHQDDDLPIAGILHRCRDRGTVAWMTNGDGLAPMAREDPEEYARKRDLEAVTALGKIGYGPRALHFVGQSELENYQLFIDLARQPQKGRHSGVVVPSLAARVMAIVDRVTGALVPLIEGADVVWTMAWQGGHVEHDLTHFLAVRAARQVEAEQGRTIPIFEFPEYELMHTVVLRYPVWRGGVRHRIELTDEEMQVKNEAFSSYDSQAALTGAFRKVIQVKGVLSALIGRPYTFDRFVRTEEFGPVPPGRDYTRPPHGIDRLEYIGEDHKGVPVRFSNSLKRIVQLAMSS